VQRQQGAGEVEVGDGGQEQDGAVDRHRHRGGVALAHPGRDEGDEREPEEQVDVRPEHAPVHALDGVQQVVVVVPVDGQEHEAQEVAGELAGEGKQVRQRGAPGGLSSSTMMVMTMAMTPSLKASRRDPVMGAPF
jgi:hypothetical protein